MEEFEKKSSPNAVAKKRNYQTPKMFIYGDIREITRAVDDMGNTDGAMGMNDRT
jgi:hypothetical protein